MLRTTTVNGVRPAPARPTVRLSGEDQLPVPRLHAERPRSRGNRHRRSGGIRPRPSLRRARSPPRVSLAAMSNAGTAKRQGGFARPTLDAQRPAAPPRLCFFFLFVDDAAPRPECAARHLDVRRGSSICPASNAPQRSGMAWHALVRTARRGRAGRAGVADRRRISKATVARRLLSRLGGPSSPRARTAPSDRSSPRRAVLSIVNSPCSPRGARRGSPPRRTGPAHAASGGAERGRTGRRPLRSPGGFGGGRSRVRRRLERSRAELRRRRGPYAGAAGCSAASPAPLRRPGPAQSHRPGGGTRSRPPGRPGAPGCACAFAPDHCRRAHARVTRPFRISAEALAHRGRRLARIACGLYPREADSGSVAVRLRSSGRNSPRYDSGCASASLPSFGGSEVREFDLFESRVPRTFPWTTVFRFDEATRLHRQPRRHRRIAGCVRRWRDGAPGARPPRALRPDYDRPPVGLDERLRISLRMFQGSFYQLGWPSTSAGGTREQGLVDLHRAVPRRRGPGRLRRSCARQERVCSTATRAASSPAG
jgi:hypothetical protein